MINKSQVNQDLTNIRSLNLVVGKANDSPKENKSAYAQGELEGSVRLLFCSHGWTKCGIAAAAMQNIKKMTSRLVQWHHSSKGETHFKLLCDNKWQTTKTKFSTDLQTFAMKNEPSN